LKFGLFTEEVFPRREMGRQVIKQEDKFNKRNEKKTIKPDNLLLL
jgi:hypothetical protein